MRQIGTITMYYDFLDNRTVEIIDSIVGESRDFRDFVVRFGEWACDQDVPPEAAYLAIDLAWELRESEVVDRIAEKYGSHPFVKPMTFPLTSRSKHLAIQQNIVEAVDEAIIANPPHWILLSLLVVKAFAFIMTPKGAETLSEANRLLEISPELSRFKPMLCHINTRLMWQEGNLASAIQDCSAGLEVAKANDDVYGVFRLLRWLSILSMESDPRRALDMLEDAYDIGLTVIGSPYHIATTLTEMGAASELLGEFDLALRFHHEGSKIYQPPHGLADVHAIHVSSIYASLEDGREALTWAEWALEQHRTHGSEGDAWTYLAIAHAQTLLHRFDEAQKNLEIANKMVIRSGHEDEMACYYCTSGVLELESGDPATAMNSFERALEISERMNIQLFIYKCLFHLTKAEIALFKGNINGSNSDTSGPYMTKFERHAYVKDLPGVVLQHALLKADFLLSQKEWDRANRVLADALAYSDSPGLKTMRKRIQDKKEELEFRLSKGAH
ncbi:MAG: hypothetical protein ACW96N_08075 [Candidatus Thorarchaeota archaeon]